MKKGEYPKAITAIAVWGFLVAVVLLFSAIGFFSAYSVVHSQKDAVINETLAQIQATPGYTSGISEVQLRKGLNAIEPLLPVMGVACLMFMLLYAVSSIFILKRKNWARLSHVILAILGILGSAVFIVSPLFFWAILNFSVDIAIAGYLLFSNSVKKVFK